ncbi:hypothetical protein [Pseudooceanicola sp. HF7]|uniref:hypothetical protein n=1 Tax=Pseudooceanicola sp. HF7 TaxID=2721560 RepID=UPI001431526A|nr:hypothetical protein [Pseudooceanicola sp. HF7]
MGPTPDVRAAADATSHTAYAASFGSNPPYYRAYADDAANAAARAACAADAVGVAAHAANCAARAAADVADVPYPHDAAARAAADAADAPYPPDAAARAAAYADTALPVEPRRMLESRVQRLQAITDATEKLSKQDGRTWVLTEGGDWDFWSRWYERAMAGDPLPWDLQREVALIPEEIWKQGPEAVAERIAEIEADYLTRTTQLSEEVTLNPATGTFLVTPRPLENAPLISALLSRTEDALEDALLGSNGLRTDMRAVKTLQRTHQRYGNDPQRIELDYTSVAISLRRELKSHELAETEDNLALLEAVEEGALAIRAQHPEIAENRQRIAQQKLQEIDREDLELLQAAEPILVALSEGTMADDFARDIPQLINDATTPLPSSAPPLPGVDESMRIFHRTSRMKVLLNDESDKGEAILGKSNAALTEALARSAKTFDSPAVKTIRLAYLAKDTAVLLWKIVEIGLKLFGVL